MFCIRLRKYLRTFLPPAMSITQSATCVIINHGNIIKTYLQYHDIAHKELMIFAYCMWATALIHSLVAYLVKVMQYIHTFVSSVLWQEKRRLVTQNTIDRTWRSHTDMNAMWLSSRMQESFFIPISLRSKQLMAKVAIRTLASVDQI